VDENTPAIDPRHSALLVMDHQAGVVSHMAYADYPLYVLSDATADTDPEVHQVLMTKVFPRQAWVITTDELAVLLPG
jgi:nicotinamidase-related amidase